MNPEAMTWLDHPRKSRNSLKKPSACPGLQVRRKAGGGSDIDLAIFSPAVSDMDLLKRVRFMVAIEKLFAEPLELHLYSLENLEQARPTNFYGEIIRTGIKIK